VTRDRKGDVVHILGNTIKDRVEDESEEGTGNVFLPTDETS
jgi:hypothetical protein